MELLFILLFVLVGCIRAHSIFPWHSSVLGFNYKMKGSLYNEPEKSSNDDKKIDSKSVVINDKLVLKEEMDKLASELSANTSSPTAIYFSQSRVSSLDMSSLIKIMLANTSTVDVLSIRHCNCDSESFQSVRSGKKYLTSSLHTLDLSFNNFDFASYRLLSSLMRRLKGLTVFVFDGNKLDTTGVQSIVYAIRRHPSISSLSFASCGIDDDMMTDLAFGIKSNPNITDLNLSCNRISDEGLLRLLAALPSPTTGRCIRRLDLSYCPIGDRGVTALADACKAGKLSGLESLTLRHLEGDISPTALTQLLQSLRNHTHLRYLDISGNLLFVDPSAVDRKGASGGGKKGGKKPSKLQRLVDGSLNQVSQLTPVAVQALQGLTDSIAGGVQGMLGQGTQGGKSKSLSSRRLLLEYDDEYNVVGSKSKTNLKGGKSKKPLSSKENSVNSPKKSVSTQKLTEKKLGSGNSNESVKSVKSKADLRAEVKATRKRMKNMQNSLRALLGVLKTSPQLSFIGLAKVGISDEVVTQLVSMTTIQQSGNTTTLTNDTGNSSNNNRVGSVKANIKLVKLRSIAKGAITAQKSSLTTSSVSTSTTHDRCIELAIGLDKISNSSLTELVACVNKA